MDDDFSRHYSDDGFWTKVRTYARRAGRDLVEKAITLFHTAQDADTPRWARTVIVGVLGYFILPLDAIPDFTPAVGFADDLGSLVTAFGILVAYIKPEHREKARRTTEEWLGRAEDAAV